MSRTLGQPIYEHIRRNLLTGRYQPGQRIAELAIAKELGVSRAPVREAIRKLAGEELIELVPGMGAYIKTPTIDELAEFYDLREAIETHAVARAAKRITRAQLRTLDESNRQRFAVLRRLKDSGRPDLTEEDAIVNFAADARFHRVILEAAGNSKMLAMVDDLKLMARVWAWRLDPTVFDLVAEYADAYICHRRIAAALRRRDVRSARMWMRRHLRTTFPRYEKQAAHATSPPELWSPAVLEAVLAG